MIEKYAVHARTIPSRIQCSKSENHAELPKLRSGPQTPNCARTNLDSGLHLAAARPKCPNTTYSCTTSSSDASSCEFCCSLCNDYMHQLRLHGTLQYPYPGDCCNSWCSTTREAILVIWQTDKIRCSQESRPQLCPTRSQLNSLRGAS